MAKFCTWCGAPLEPGARFCGECGGRIPESSSTAASKAAGTPDVLRGFGIPDVVEELPADATLRMDRDAVVVPVDNEPKRFSLDGVKKRPGALAIAGIVFAVLIALGAAAFAWSYFQGGKEVPADPVPVVQPAQDEPAESVSDQDKSPVSQKVDDKAPSESSPAEAYAALDAAYKKLSAYDDRIGECVSDFNSVFLARSMSDRNAAKDFADQVLSDLKADAAALEALKLSSDSPYKETLDNVIELYGCQIGRVSAMTEAWALDVTFDVPSEHKDEILAVYAAGKSSDYLSRYDELYPSSAPVEV